MFLSLLFILQTLWALPHNSQMGDRVADALRQPHEIGLRTIQSLGSEGRPLLEDLAFNEKWPMKTRWKSFMLLTLSDEKKALPVIKKALVSKTWFMRSAGLTALDSLDPQGAKKWAYKFLNSDPALMVRMKALEVLKGDNSEKVTELFWKKVNSSDSLHNKKSLWIRTDLAKILARSPRQKDLKRWVGLLHDGDRELQALATLALGKLHQAGGAEQDSVAYWQQKYPTTNL